MFDRDLFDRICEEEGIDMNHVGAFMEKVCPADKINGVIRLLNACPEFRDILLDITSQKPDDLPPAPESLTQEIINRYCGGPDPDLPSLEELGLA